MVATTVFSFLSYQILLIKLYTANPLTVSRYFWSGWRGVSR